MVDLDKDIEIWVEIVILKIILFKLILGIFCFNCFGSWLSLVCVIIFIKRRFSKKGNEIFCLDLELLIIKEI